MKRGAFRAALCLPLSLLALGCARGCGSATPAPAADAAAGREGQASGAAPRDLPEVAFTGHFPSRVEFSPDGKLLATAGHDEVLVWDVTQRRVAAAFTVRAESLQFSADGRRVLVRTLTDVRVLTLDGEQVSGPIPDMGAPDAEVTERTRIEGVGWLGPNEVAAAFENGESVSVVDGKPGSRARLSARKLSFAAWDPGRRRVVLAPSAPEEPLELVGGADLAQRAQLPWPGRDSAVLALCFSPSGHALAGLDNRVDNGVRVWETATGRQSLALREPTDRVNGLAWSPDGKRLALALHEKGLAVVSAETGAVQKSRALPGWNGEGVAWSPDGRTLAVTWRALTLHDADSLELTARLWDAGDDVSGIACAANEDGVAGVTKGGDVLIWDLAEGALRVLPKLADKATRVFWVDDDKRLVVAAGAELVVVERATSAIRRVERKLPFGELEDVSPDGQWLAEVQWLEPDGKSGSAAADAGESLPGDLPPQAAPGEGLLGLGAARVGRPHLLLRPLEGGKPRDLGIVADTGSALFSANGRRVGVVTERGIEIFDVATGSVVRRITTPPRAPDPTGRRTHPFGALSPDGAQIVVPAEKPGLLEIWNVAEGRAGTPFRGTSSGPLAFARDGASFVTAEGNWHALPRGEKIGALGPIPPGRRCVGRDGRWAAGPDPRGITVLGRDGKRLTLGRVPSGTEWRMFVQSSDGTFDADDEVLAQVRMRRGRQLFWAKELTQFRKAGLVAAFTKALARAP